MGVVPEHRVPVAVMGRLRQFIAVHGWPIVVLGLVLLAFAVALWACTAPIHP